MARPSVEDERREQIMEATRRVMVQRGLSELRVADIAREAGISPGIVHYYFETKEDLIMETFEDTFAASIDYRNEILALDLPAREKLMELLHSYVPDDDETIERWHVWMEMWVGALHDEQLRKINDQAYGMWRSMVTEIIREGQTSGAFSPVNLWVVSNNLVSMVDGLAVQVLLGSSIITAEEMDRLMSEFIDKNLV